MVLLKRLFRFLSIKIKMHLKQWVIRKFFDFQKNKYTLEEAINKIKINSKRYAKRQMTWFNSDKSINWFLH